MMRYLFKKKQIIVTILLLALPFIPHTQIQVNSVNSTPISCPNNGTITIDATTSSPPLLYSIIAGPAIQPVQTNPVFSSLLPGNYTIKISDGAGNETTALVSITGTYINPNFTATTVKPYCVGENSGEITGIINPGTGNAPFTWEMIAPSPLLVPSQSSNVFTNLPAGNYTMRLSDACGSYKTSVITLAQPNTINPFYGGILVNKIGCDTMNLFYRLYMNDVRLPLTFKYETSDGVYHYSSATEMEMWGGFIRINQTVPGVDYGETVKVTVYNACGDSISNMVDINPFLFYPSYSYSDCGNDVTLSFVNHPSLQPNMGFMPPISYTVTEVPTNIIVDQGSVMVTPPADITDTYIYGFSTTAVEVGHAYHVSITDGCGDLFVQNYTIPSKAPPVILGKGVTHRACIDSVVGLYRVHTAGLMNGKLVITNGPATLGSTKPGFEYSDTYSYPDTLNIGYGEIFFIQNMAVGTYHFKIIDDCGYEFLDSIVITPQQVSNLGKNLYWEKGCLGKNKIFYSMTPKGKVSVKDLATNTIVKTSEFDYTSIPYLDSALNLNSGQYEVIFEYKQPGYGPPINDNIHSCWIIRDTIDIEAYQTPEMSTGNAIMCNNTINFVLVPDSSKGVPPYQYEIISGPQTFPVQNSNIFTITEPGTYLARIFDVCENASIKQITVDTISFDPIEVNVNCNHTNLIFPSSIYFTYEWLMPNNQVHVGDSLILDPVTPADTGTYHISKIININGCIDTLHTTYHVTLNNYLAQTIPFCTGTDVHVGTNIYDSPGIYHDTLTSVLGCDSIVVTTLTILPQNADTTQITICQGDSLEIGGQYYHTAGFYLDSVQNSFGCYDLLVTDLSVNQTVDTIHASICPGGNYLFGGDFYGNPGFYNDTLISTSGCDSISVLHLTVLPYIQHAANETICTNESYLFGGNLLTQQGIYIDTLSTATCDSIVTLTLTVLPYIYNTVNHVLCEGESYSFGNNVHTLPGVYIDTLSTTTCDSIVTLTLDVLPFKHHTIHETICSGENYPFSGVHYIQSGTYTSIFPTNTCDSIVTLHLTVNPAPSVNIVSTAYETENGVFVQLNAISNTNPLSYEWTSSSILNSYTIKNPTTTIQIPTWIYVLVTDTSGCTSTDGKQVLIPVTSTLYVPNTFTPNGDEANNIFMVYGTNIAQFTMTIYDRWGEVIFETTDIHSGWDGTYKSKIVQDGTYVYKIEAIGMDYVYYNKTGHISVLK